MEPSNLGARRRGRIALGSQCFGWSSSTPPQNSGGDSMPSLARMLSAAAFLFAVCFFVATAGDKKAPPPPRSLGMIEAGIAGLEDLVAALEKGTGMDEKQKASAYARLLALAEQAKVGLAQQRTLTMTAVNSPPKNDPTGGQTNA